MCLFLSKDSEEEVDGDVRPRSNSFSGSIKTRPDNSESSCDSSLSNLKEKSNTLDGKNKVSLKDFKDKPPAAGKTKMEKKMQHVTKSFGSIGRSMSKKFKKMGGIGKGGNTKEGENDRRSSVGSATQSTKVLSQVELAQNQDLVLCARLQVKRLEYQDRMVKNYMETANKRFIQDRNLKKKQDEEMRRKVELKQKQMRLKQQQQVDNVEEYSSENNTNLAPLSKPEETVDLECVNANTNATVNQVEGYHSRPEDKVDRSGMPRQNTLIDVGQSKFYTFFDEEQCLEPENAHDERDGTMSNTNQSNSLGITHSSSSSELNNVRRLNKGRKDVAVELCNSSFYDESLSRSEYCNVRSSGVPVSVTRSVPEGTSFVNNLHNEYVENGSYTKQDKYHKPAPLAKEYTNRMAVEAQNISPTRRKAFKIRDSANGGGGNSEYSDKLNLNVFLGDLDLAGSSSGGTKYSTVNEKNELSSQRNNLQKPCREDGCKYYGTIATDFYCSACFKLKQKSLSYAAHVNKK